MERLLRDRGIDHEHFASGRPEAVEMFADAVGHDLLELQRNAIRVFRLGGEFRGEATSKPFLLPQAKRYCPACLAEDGGPTNWRFRLLWGFRHVQRCTHHGLWLTPTGKTGAINLRVALNDAHYNAPSDASGETPTYLDWLRHRVHGGGPLESSWLADQSMEQVLAASEMIGGVLQHGHKVRLTKLSQEAAEEAIDIGFSIYQEGHEAVEEALDTIRNMSPASAVQAGPLAHYGVLFDWLDRRSNAIDPGPIRDLLRDHIVKHSAVEPGTTVLGEEITVRRYHSLPSLSLAVGIDRKRLSRILKKLGKIPSQATEIEAGKMVFEAAQTVPLVEAFQTAIPLRDARDYIGATKLQFEVLYRTGAVQPLVPRTSQGSVRHVVFARNHLDALLAQIEELVEIVHRDRNDFHSLTYASQRGAGRFEHLFTEILNRRIPAFRDPSKKGISSILVEVKPLVETANAA
jgi:hypothetical protein